MSAETLRKAAALMRERAEAMDPYPAPWSVAPGPGVRDLSATKIVSAGFDVVPRDRNPVVEYVASWHPDVALAVADWLDEMVTDFEPEWARLVRGFGEDAAREFLPTRYDDAFKVARAYLGEQP